MASWRDRLVRPWCASIPRPRRQCRRGICACVGELLRFAVTKDPKLPSIQVESGSATKACSWWETWRQDSPLCFQGLEEMRVIRLSSGVAR